MLLDWFYQLVLLTSPLLLPMGGVYAAEALFPLTRPAMSVTVRALGFWAIYIPLQAAVFVLAPRLMPINFPPLILINTREWPLGWLIGPFVAVLVADFFYYWMHRLQHVAFWRFHAVHHAIRDLSAVNGYNHPSEVIFRHVFMALPMALLLGVNAKGALLVTAFFATHGYYIHSCTRLNFGPLRWLIADNRYHRIHHSIEERHWNKNFAATTPIWDVLFGTAYLPCGREWPQTGLEDRPPVQGLRDYLMRPFARQPAPEPARSQADAA